jgi:hypothetical protein
MTAYAHSHPHSHSHAQSALSAWLDNRFDRMAIGLSGLCAVHCVASTILLAAMASLGTALLNPIYHEIGLGFAIIFGVFALGRGALRHGYLMPVASGSLGIGMMAGALSLPQDGGLETLATVMGVMLLSLGHDLNRRATH